MMDAIVVAALGVLAVTVTGGLLAWQVHFEPRRDGKRWMRAAAALGLTLDGRGGSYGGYAYITNHMVGAFGGVPVRVGIRWEVVSSRRSIIQRRRYYTYVEVAIARPLDAGLHLSPSGWLRWMEALGAVDADVQVGHRALDAAYMITASNAEEARRLLTTPYVLEPLLALSSAPFRPYVRDSVVKLEARRKRLDADVLYVVIENAIELAGRLAAAREALGPSHVERVIGGVWAAVAAARELTLDLERRAMAGRAEGVHVEVHAVQRGTHCATRFLVRFDRPLGFGLRLERQAGMVEIDVLFGGLQDIRTGDATFDRRFVVRGQPEAAVRAALTPEVRARLVSLQERAPSLTVQDDHLYADAGWLLSEPEHLHAAITAIAQAGAALRSASERAMAAYRG